METVIVHQQKGDNTPVFLHYQHSASTYDASLCYTSRSALTRMQLFKK